MQNVAFQKPVVLPKLCQFHTNGKVIIPENVEKAIRNFCAFSPHKEWSGILFYTFSGSFDTEIVLECKDILLLNQGTSVFTEFSLNTPEVARYMVLNGLMGCCTGLIHSHNTMATFFSGTDTSTLQKEGNDTNNFLSLIVNNEGTYTAAITRKVSYNVKTKTEEHKSGQYPFFNTEESIHLEDVRNSYSKDTTEEVIEFSYLGIEKPDDIDADYAFEMLGKISMPKPVENETTYGWGKPKEITNTPKQLSFEGPSWEKPSWNKPAKKEENFEDYDIDEILNDSSIWNTKEYLIFFEQIFIGSPFISEPHSKSIKEELAYFESKILPRYCQRFTDPESFFEWVATMADFYLYDYDFSFIEEKLPFEADKINDIPAIVATKTADLLLGLNPKSKFAAKYLETIVGVLSDRSE